MSDKGKKPREGSLAAVVAALRAVRRAEGPADRLLFALARAIRGAVLPGRDLTVLVLDRGSFIAGSPEHQQETLRGAILGLLRALPLRIEWAPRGENRLWPLEAEAGRFTGLVHSDGAWSIRLWGSGLVGGRSVGVEEAKADCGVVLRLVGLIEAIGGR